jgi:hypothetical protein
MSPGRNIVIYRLLPIKGLKPHFLNYYLLVNNGSRNLATSYKILYNTVLHALQKTYKGWNTIGGIVDIGIYQ